MKFAPALAVAEDQLVIAQVYESGFAPQFLGAF
jgi:hypothetical protein